MKINNLIFKYFLFSAIITCLSIAQDISVHNFIGKSQKDVVKKYGKPVHKDNSNPEMICSFYKSGSNTMIFVADKKGIYQAEASKSYDTEGKARSEIDALITTSIAHSFFIDTVSINDFNIYKSGVKVDLQISENKLTNKFDIRVNAKRSED